MSKNQEIQAIPLENTITNNNDTKSVIGKLTGMKTNIDSIDNKGILDYTPNGIYEVETSSYYSNKTQGFNAFNDNINSYWECDNINNPNYTIGARKYPQYTQKTYIGKNPSSYMGGGDIDNTWITSIGTGENSTDIRGEWIQIKLPYQLYLTNFTIVTPMYSAVNTFPMKFTLAASNDGIKWDYVEQYFINKSKLPPPRNPSSTFYVSSYLKYSYFRIIVTEMPEKMDKLRINTIKLKGTTYLSKTETFMSLNRSIDSSSGKTHNLNSIEGADFFRPTYSYIQNNTKNKVKEPIETISKYNEFDIDNIGNNILFYTSIGTCALISSIFIHNFFNKH